MTPAWEIARSSKTEKKHPRVLGWLVEALSAFSQRQAAQITKIITYDLLCAKNHLCTISYQAAKSPMAVARAYHKNQNTKGDRTAAAPLEHLRGSCLIAEDTKGQQHTNFIIITKVQDATPCVMKTR
ncbi:unnamed protein product [Acanthoscelides obtectus]|uniref:Uncharacterized protein n=1 Tax=Acanthoscelides obtectus TaxID=200917 RepID=A0A9P0JNG0_ACAOB|nr:unnamed protein product [Acanthoscelides obtectus]CAK1654326.1 hypothetical protein AOBTE_LOCUS18525 [Acanthoscelides obtectus]